MRTLLVVPPEEKVIDVKQTGSKWPRVGIGYIAAYLRQKGIDVSILDCKAEEILYDKISKYVLDFKPNVVGVTSFTEEIYSAAKVCEEIKKIDSKIITVIGGPHASAIPRETLEEFSKIDVAVVGEGEESLFEIASGNPYETIKGIFYRKEDKIFSTQPRPLIPNIDLLPFPAWDLFPLDQFRGILARHLREKTNKKNLELPLLSARGCPCACQFCYRVFGTTLRLRTPENIVDEIQYDMNRFNVVDFYFAEGSFGINKKWGEDICEEIIRRKLNDKINWIAETRVDVTKELLEKMKKAGCVQISFGLESGHPKILEESGKGITIEMAYRAVHLAKEIGLRVQGFFIFGHPHETTETISETMKFINKLNIDILNIGIMTPYPGTRIYEMAQKKEGGYKFLNRDWSEYTKQRGGGLDFEHVSLSEIRKFQSEAYFKFYLKPNRLLKVIQSLPLKKIINITADLFKNTFKR